MAKETHALNKAKKLSAEQKKALKEKEKSFKNKLEVGKWYKLLVEVNGDTLKASIDDKQVGSFSSPGIAHPTKRTLRLAVPKNAVVDDLKIWKK